MCEGYRGSLGPDLVRCGDAWDSRDMVQPSRDHALVRTKESKAAAVAKWAGRAVQERSLLKEKRKWRSLGWRGIEGHVARRPKPRPHPAHSPRGQATARRSLHSKPSGHAAHWIEWRRRNQARSRWFHKRARLARNYALVS
jgi:hypothetical protein